MKINYLIKTSLVSTGKFVEKFACTLLPSFEYNVNGAGVSTKSSQFVCEVSSTNKINYLEWWGKKPLLAPFHCRFCLPKWYINHTAKVIYSFLQFASFACIVLLQKASFALNMWLHALSNFPCELRCKAPSIFPYFVVSRGVAWFGFNTDDPLSTSRNLLTLIKYWQ